MDNLSRIHIFQQFAEGTFNTGDILNLDITGNNLILVRSGFSSNNTETISIGVAIDNYSFLIPTVSGTVQLTKVENKKYKILHADNPLRTVYLFKIC